MKIIAFLSGVLCTLLASIPVFAAPGDLDVTYNPDPVVAAGIAAIAVQADGKLLLGGTFQSVAGVPRPYIARLNADGTLDTGFNTVVNGPVYGFTLRPGGTIYINAKLTNGFTSVYGVTSFHCAWLNDDGTVNRRFTPPYATPNGSAIFPVALQPDGKVIVGGFFTGIIDVSNHLVPLKETLI